MRRLLSRACAALMVLVMLALSPANLPQACDRCPPDCPMHAMVVVPDADEPLPCHRGERASGDEADCVVRAACGHDGAFVGSVALRLLLPALSAAPYTVSAHALELDGAPAPAWDPSAPPTAPPRAAVA